MATKYELITERYLNTAGEIAKPEVWPSFLTTACHNFRLSFDKQVLLYAQRPDATACASIEVWNEKMHCWVNKGAKGIALIDDDTNTGLKYVFDISDVHKARRIGRFPNLWEIQEEH